MKRILGFLVMSLFVFWFWVYADVIPIGSHWVSKCVAIQNPEIDDYRVVVTIFGVMDEKIYEPKAGECLQGHYHADDSNQYLVEKSIPLDELTIENIDDKARTKRSLNVNGYYTDDSDSTTEVKKTYTIVKSGNVYNIESPDDIPKYKGSRYDSIKNSDSNKTNDSIKSIGVYKIEEDIETGENIENNNDIITEDGIETEENTGTNEVVESRDLDNHVRTELDFLIALVLTILIETWVLFIIKILNWLTYSALENWITVKYPVKNAKVLLSWILASAITLPLLRYIFPLFLWDGIIYVVGGELLVFLIETVILKYMMNISRKKALVVSFICNLASFLIGILLEYLDFWLFSF